MDSNILILVLTVLGVSVHAHPWGLGFEVGASTKVDVNSNTTGKVVPGFDNGLTVDAKGRGQVAGSWQKNVFGKVYAVNSKGDVIGVSGSAGSVVEGEASAEGEAKLKTNLINTKIDKNGSLDGKASYKAGADVHFINKNEIKGIEGLNTGLNKHSEKKPVDPTQSAQESNQEDAQDSEPKGFLKKAWDWIG